MRPGGRGLAPLTLAVLLLANAALGPAALDLVSYPLPTTILNQLRGLELVTVALVVPALILAAVLLRRGRREASLVAIGPCAYTSYMFVQYVVGPDRSELSPAVLLHLAIFVLATVLTAAAWTRAAGERWPAPDAVRRRRWAALLLALAGFVALRYVPLAVGSLTGAAIPGEFRSTPGFYWTVVLLDVGLVVPAAVAAAVAVWRWSPLTVPAVYGVVGWFALVPPSVAAMSVVMLARDDPYASMPTAVLLTATSVITTTVAIRMFATLLVGRRRTTITAAARTRAASSTGSTSRTRAS